MVKMKLLLSQNLSVNVNEWFVLKNIYHSLNVEKCFVYAFLGQRQSPRNNI